VGVFCVRVFGQKRPIEAAFVRGPGPHFLRTWQYGGFAKFRKLRSDVFVRLRIIPKLARDTSNFARLVPAKDAQRCRDPSSFCRMTDCI